MKMPNAPVAVRRKVHMLLERFFDDYQKPDFDNAMQLLADAYGAKVPEVTFYEYLGYGRVGGFTWEDGKIELQHPENWKKARINSKAKWVRTVLHEFAHYLFWADAEAKADRFENHFLKGIRQ